MASKDSGIMSRHPAGDRVLVNSSCHRRAVQATRRTVTSGRLGLKVQVRIFIESIQLELEVQIHVTRRTVACDAKPDHWALAALNHLVNVFELVIGTMALESLCQ
jgi:hypothetical protein